MSVPIEEVVPGAVFQFGKFQRQVLRLEKDATNGMSVRWQRPDGSRSGKQWLSYFAEQAKPIGQAVKPTYEELECEIAKLEDERERLKTEKEYWKGIAIVYGPTCLDHDRVIANFLRKNHQRKSLAAMSEGKP